MFSDLPELTESTVSATKSCLKKLSIFKLKKMEGSWIWSVKNNKIMRIYTTRVDAQNKVNVICLCLLYMPIKNKICWL